MSNVSDVLRGICDEETINQMMAVSEMAPEIYEKIFQDLHPSVFFSLMPTLVDYYCVDKGIDDETKMEFMRQIVNGMELLSKSM